jgi:hypothetical protein
MTSGRRPGYERLDEKKRPVGKRAGFDHVVDGSERAVVCVSEGRTPGDVGVRSSGTTSSQADLSPVAVDRWRTVRVPTIGASRPRSAADRIEYERIAEWLRNLWGHGSRYYRGRSALTDCLRLASLGRVALGGARNLVAIRQGASDVLLAANALRPVVAEIGELPGLELVTEAAARLENSLHAWVVVELSEADDGQKVNAYASVHEAMQSLGCSYLSDEPLVRDVDVAGGLRSRSKRAVFDDDALQDAQDAIDPLAPGAIGLERIVRMNDGIRSAVAWHGWRAAGRGVSWERAWDLWTPLNRYSGKLVGQARDATSKAVSETRRTNRAESSRVSGGMVSRRKRVRPQG